MARRREAMRKGAVVAAVVVSGIVGAACSGWNNERGIGDAPVDQQPDEARKVWPNADKFPNISAFCIGGNGVYTTTRQAPPAIVVDDPECAEGGILATEGDD
jgi:hypothetical protein